MRIVYLLMAFSLIGLPALAQPAFRIKEMPVGEGWAGNSVNTVVFRKNSLCSYRNLQYIAYYNNDGFVVLGKRKINGHKWELRTTGFKGNVADAHNSISIMTDGEGYLHMAWDHHNNKLHYRRSLEPGTLQMSEEMPMTGNLEEKVSYPEFHALPGGDLLFLYRDGRSGGGNLVVNRYSAKEKKWIQLHQNLVDGEKKRNAYWQACVDATGTIHLSWVWRESPDVASNHDMGYARSKDGGVSWENSNGDIYQVPIKEATAEYAARIPQRSELINQTSMYADEKGNPFIASYWREKNDSVPQYHILYNIGKGWQVQNLGFRRRAFSLSGAGTKRIPISRPQLVAWRKNDKYQAMLIFRDEEAASKPMAALTEDLQSGSWKLETITDMPAGSWEPSYDTELWKRKRRMDLFVQYTDQQDAEGKSMIPAQMVKVISMDMK